MSNIIDKIYALAMVKDGNIVELIGSDGMLLIYNADRSDGAEKHATLGGYTVVPCSILIEIPDEGDS